MNVVKIIRRVFLRRRWYDDSRPEHTPCRWWGDRRLPNKSDKTRSTGSLIIIICIFSSYTIGIVTTTLDREYRKRCGGGGGVASSGACPAPVSLACFYHSSVLFARVRVRARSVRACVCSVPSLPLSMETSCLPPPPPPPHMAV